MTHRLTGLSLAHQPPLVSGMGKPRSKKKVAALLIEHQPRFAGGEKPKGRWGFKAVGLLILTGALGLVAYPFVSPDRPASVQLNAPRPFPTKLAQEDALSVFQQMVTRPLLDNFGTGIKLRTQVPIFDNRGKVYAFENNQIDYELLTLPMANGKVTVINVAPKNSDQRGSWLLIESDKQKDLYYFAHDKRSAFADQVMGFLSGRGALPQPTFSTQVPELTQTASRDFDLLRATLQVLAGEHLPTDAFDKGVSKGK